VTVGIASTVAVEFDDTLTLGTFALAFSTVPRGLVTLLARVVDRRVVMAGLLHSFPSRFFVAKACILVFF
jgi:hypothetical protein